jgi:2-oxoisovalerate ferredoxin oxidoreductase beta subunit
MVVATKATSLYQTFERKESNKEVTHYCPGCGHGIIHNLVAEAIDKLGIQDRTIFLSPVGCAVFGYYYFDTGNIQCSHGRAPAVATGIKRSHKDSIVISYQGDGDLAGIGMAEIIHAANRGENITVFFINNATYGMTGGQMAPTTLVGEKSLTTPFGRSVENDGEPIGVAELLNSLKTPTFIQRCSVASTKDILTTKKAVKKALENQITNKGFSFVEILAPCPTNWKLTPLQARDYIKQQLQQVFPLKVFRDEDKTIEQEKREFLDSPKLKKLLLKNPIHLGKSNRRQLKGEKKIIVGGFGGQGIMLASKILATCALIENKSVTYLPSYGPEMRGGGARVDLIISDQKVGSPLVDRADYLLAMNENSFDLHINKVKWQGFVIKNTQNQTDKEVSNKVKVVELDANKIAANRGTIKGANIVMVATLIKQTNLFSFKTLVNALKVVIDDSKIQYLNLKLIEDVFRTNKELSCLTT